jgi:hypothetical protein
MRFSVLLILDFYQIFLYQEGFSVPLVGKKRITVGNAGIEAANIWFYNMRTVFPAVVSE